MINETSPITDLLVNGTIPISVKMVSAVNWPQFALTAAIGLISVFSFFIIIYLPKMVSALNFTSSLSGISRYLKNNVVMIKHANSGLFNLSMIDQTTIREMSDIMNKMKGKDFDLVLHTPGGDIFSSLTISRLIKQYPGKIRAIIPLYSMSGGSLLALSCDEIIMTNNACIGPIDPQLGNIFKYGSAKNWEKIVKLKGDKAEDQSISFAMTGKQYTDSIRKHLLNIIDFRLCNKDKDKLSRFLTDGKVEHSFPLTVQDLHNFNLNVTTINDQKLLKKLSSIIGTTSYEGVTYYIRKWWWPF